MGANPYEDLGPGPRDRPDLLIRESVDDQDRGHDQEAKEDEADAVSSQSSHEQGAARRRPGPGNPPRGVNFAQL